MSAHSTDLNDFDHNIGSGSVPVESARQGSRHLYRGFLKRFMDISFVVGSAPFWMPIVLIAALLIARDGHNPFYTQNRIGRNGRLFRIWKLRSMVVDAEERLEAHLAADPVARAEWESTQKLKDDPRITRTGRIIRKTSLDELPQLWNVLTGDMSLVGPRPMMISQRGLYHGESYFELRPGLTGFWQISDRNECRFSDRARFDEAYHRSLSLRTDMVVLARTVAVVVRGTGY